VFKDAIIAVSLLCLHENLYSSFLSFVQISQGFLPSVAGERTRRPKVQDTLTIPICQTSTYTFKDTAELIAFQVLSFSSSNCKCTAACYPRLFSPS